MRRVAIENPVQLNGSDIVHLVMEVISKSEHKGFYNTQMLINWDHKVRVSGMNGLTGFTKRL
jgi:hypothetical protein